HLAAGDKPPRYGPGGGSPPPRLGTRDSGLGTRPMVDIVVAVVRSAVLIGLLLGGMAYMTLFARRLLRRALLAGGRRKGLEEAPRGGGGRRARAARASPVAHGATGLDARGPSPPPCRHPHHRPRVRRRGRHDHTLSARARPGLRG